MKPLFFLATLIIVSPFGYQAQAASDEFVISCTTTLSMPDEARKAETKIQVFERASELRAKTTQTIDGYTSSREDKVQFLHNLVREGINPDTMMGEMNGFSPGEALIAHAMHMEANPVFKGHYKSGFDLAAVRSVKVFQIVEDGIANIGLVAIVEGYDQNGNRLGSFLGGFLVSPCR